MLNRRTSKEEWATLYTPIADNNVDDFDNEWRPIMDAALSKLTTQSAIEAAQLQDAHWKWRDKHQARSNRFDWESFAVECDGLTQGLMFLRTVGFAREPSQKNLPLVYIDLLSVAPWNRPTVTTTPKYKGVGPLLLGAALSFSISEGLDGRLGLHSLPQSESWYRDVCKMSEIGPDTAYPGNLVYFEFTPAQAQAYLTHNNN